MDKDHGRAAAAGEPRPPPAGAGRAILQPARNCWRVDRADRFLCVQDGADAFRWIREALLAARHSIFILGWDLQAVDLLPPGLPRRGRPREGPTRLDQVLAHVTRRHPRLRCHVLIWDYGPLFVLERDPLLRWRLGWGMPRGVRFGYDDFHPTGASHHQKIVVVDDALAFCGSLDLTAHRIDTSAHRPDEPARVTAGGIAYGPYHEVHAMVSGPVAAGLGLLARDRWRALGAKGLPDPAPKLRDDPWPAAAEPDLTGVAVGIARTMPRFGSQPGVRECETLLCDAIAAARRSIYLESQYFTSERIGRSLAERLGEPRGPEVIVVVPRECHGWLERNTMGAFRDVVFRHLAAADAHGRLRLLFPATSQARNVPTFVHSKVLIVDDILARIGSANIARRSMGMDTECDLAVEASADPAARAGIARIRDRLLGEHLGLAPEAVADAVARAGSIRAVIDERQAADRTLRRLVLPQEVDTPPGAVLDAADPDGPDTLEGLLDPDTRRRGAGSIEAVAALLAAVAFTPALIAVVAGFARGTVTGAAVALVVSLVAAALGHAAGRAIGMRGLQYWISRPSWRSARLLATRSLREVLALRFASVAGAGAANLLCGAMGVPFATALAGAAIGMAPGVIAGAALGGLIRRAFEEPTWRNGAVAIAVTILVVATAALLRALLRARRFVPAVAHHRDRVQFG